MIMITMIIVMIFIKGAISNEVVVSERLFTVRCELASQIGSLCTYQQPSRGLDPGDIRANSAGFADFCCHFLVWDRGIGPLLHFRGKIYTVWERPAGVVTSPPS